ncbi:MAG: PmeII family type II restriction endonuclease [Bacteroidales bacterium]
MGRLTIDELNQYIEAHIGEFHQRRIETLEGLKLSTILKRKNPYLYRAKAQFTAEQIVRNIVDAFLSSNEETIFGDWMEGLAIYINSKTYGGYKSGIRGIDLEFDKEGIRYIVTIKSGPNWGNSSQIGRMIQDFKTAIKTLRSSNSGLIIQPVNGCCYGKEAKPDKGDYFKYCGQQFWYFISGNPRLYLDLIIPLGHKAREKNEEFQEEYLKIINVFTREFSNTYCKVDGSIDWDAILKFNSSSTD